VSAPAGRPFRLRPLGLPGCHEILPTVARDRRGSFVKTFHREAFAAAGLAHDFAEEYYSVSRQGVLRGLHFQVPPRDHAKLVYCVAGSVLDALLDLRRGSPTYGEHRLVTLSSRRRNLVYVAPGLAHGFYVTSRSATLVYKTTTVHAPDCDRGVRWDSAGIPWPDREPVLSDRDRGFPALADFDSPFVHAA
jgi:dTDP-4-dehydrorhamnose 3,5-epimerase